MRKTLHLMLLRSFLPVLIIAVVFFVTILQLLDLFQNLTRYIDLEVPLAEVLRVQLLYVPKTVHFALPMSLLFAVAFSLGTLYSHNELIAVFGSGVSLSSFVRPILVIGLLLSAGTFAFEEYVVIDTLREKNRLERELLNITQTASNSNVTRLGDQARLLYHADYFNDATESLSNVVLIERDQDGDLVQIVSARSARWTGQFWEVQSARVFSLQGNEITEEYVQRRDLTQFALDPSAFRRVGQDIDELRLEEARLWIESQQIAGLPYRRDLTKYHERFSFALTPFIVVLVSSAIGGRFRKNILLMSLLVSLTASVVYYVIQMIAGLLASSGYMSPVLGAWTGFLIFFGFGVVLFRISRT